MATTDLQRANLVLKEQAQELGKAAVAEAVAAVAETIQKTNGAMLAKAIPADSRSIELAKAAAVVLTTQDPSSRSFRLWSVVWMIVGLVATSTDVQTAMADILGLFWADGVSYLPFVVSICSILYSKYKDKRLSAV